jgi:MerR family mercuric resistance operon transcriptional regulator
MRTNRLSTGELAEHGGVNLQTIRYYAREGLLATPPWSASGYRSYPADSVRRVRFIKRAQELGFSLAEIRELLAVRIDPKRNCSDVRRLAQAKIMSIDEKMQTLIRMRRVLAQLADACPGRGPSDDCPILDTIESDQE